MLSVGSKSARLNDDRNSAMDTYLKFQSIEIPYAVNEDPVSIRQIRCLCKVFGSVAVGLGEVFDNVVKNGMLVVVRGRAIHNLLMQSSQVIGQLWRV